MLGTWCGIRHHYIHRLQARGTRGRGGVNRTEKATCKGQVKKQSQKRKTAQSPRFQDKLKGERKKESCTVQTNSGTPSNTHKNRVPPVRHLSSIASEGCTEMKADARKKNEKREGTEARKWGASSQKQPRSIPTAHAFNTTTPPPWVIAAPHISLLPLYYSSTTGLTATAPAYPRYP